VGRRRNAPPARTREVSLDRYRSIIPDWAAFTRAAERMEPTVFRVRTGRIAPDALLERLQAQGFRVVPLVGMPAFFRVEDGPRPVTFTLEYWLGLMYVQQASTGVAAPALAPAPGERVLDLCSAPGGKTTHMADLMEDRGPLVAVEVNEGRIRGLLGNVYRLGHPNILVVSGDGRDFPEEARFDRVLVDAPCSGEGTLRRRGGRPPNQSDRFMGYVAKVQEALLRKAIRVTRPGGAILYVTCTFAPEENERVVSRVLQDEPVELEPLDLPVPHAPGLTHFEGERFDPRMEGAARIYPHHLDSGGLFLARLRRLDDGSAPPPDAWGPVPSVFPGDEMEDRHADGLIGEARETLEGHFGVRSSFFQGLSWIARGGRLWLHGLPEWPVDGWTPGGWRPVSVGFRAMEFDSHGRTRPTNDVLRWLGEAVTSGVADVDDDEVLDLCSGRPVPRKDDLGGLLALRYRGFVVGRGVTRREGIRSEIPGSLATDLRGVVEGKGAAPGQGSVTPPVEEE
jgi:NOL1/NOP2/sun family putative RNA methylase